MELGEREHETRRLARRSAWRIHGIILLLWSGPYLFSFGSALGIGGVHGAVASFFGMILASYAVSTTLLMAVFGRWPAAAIVVHALATAGLVASFMRMMLAPAAAEEAMLARESVRPEHCLRVHGIHVREGTPLRAVVRLANACDDDVTLVHVTVLGESPDGERLLMALPAFRPVPRAQDTTVDVQTIDQSGATSTAGWNWSVHLELASPKPDMCYATQGSERRHHCAAMGPVEPAPQ